MKPAILLAIITLAACGGRQPDWVSPNGSEFFYEEGTPHWDPAQIAHQESSFIEAVSRFPGYPASKVRDAIRQVEVHIYSKPLSCPGSSPSGLCSGLEDFQTIKVVNRGCPYNSAFTHEEGHWIQYAVRGVTDYGHTDTAFWKVADAAAGTCP